MKDKKDYQKPQLTKVRLRTEEAVLTACKTTSGQGPYASKCTGAGNCRIQGT
jgi:hypothetical protein